LCRKNDGNTANNAKQGGELLEKLRRKSHGSEHGLHTVPGNDGRACLSRLLARLPLGPVVDGGRRFGNECTDGCSFPDLSNHTARSPNKRSQAQEAEVEDKSNFYVTKPLERDHITNLPKDADLGVARPDRNRYEASEVKALTSQEDAPVIQAALRHHAVGSPWTALMLGAAAEGFDRMHSGCSARRQKRRKLAYDHKHCRCHERIRPRHTGHFKMFTQKYI
jgi:hypothetical protein